MSDVNTHHEEIEAIGYALGRMASEVAGDGNEHLLPDAPLAADWDHLRDELGREPDWSEERSFVVGYKDGLAN